MTEREDLQRFSELTYEDFRRLAGEAGLSPHERIGFPDSYREGHERRIFADILAKLVPLREQEKRVLDVGAGCSHLPRLLIDHCSERRHELLLVDSPEMLAHLPEGPGVSKIEGRFPEETEASLAPHTGRVDAILCYSVFHYVFAEGNPFAFLDAAMELLAPGGELLIGDIPNVSKRRRFFSSPAGVAFHKRFMDTDEPPSVETFGVEPGKIDDAVILSLIVRARQAGLEGYVLPQPDDLPMANRREDVLIRRS